MLTADASSKELRLPNTPHLTPNHTVAVVAHLLRKLYTQELENEPCCPDGLKPLIERLRAQERSRLEREQG